MDQMLYELHVAERHIEEINSRIKHYVGNDADYLAQMSMKKAELQVKVNKVQKAIELFKEAVAIGY